MSKYHCKSKDPPSWRMVGLCAFIAKDMAGSRGVHMGPGRLYLHESIFKSLEHKIVQVCFVVFFMPKVLGCTIDIAISLGPKGQVLAISPQ